MSAKGLLGLEGGQLRYVRDPRLHQRLVNFGRPTDQPDDSSDAVLVACCDDWLQEGDGGRALWLAHQQLSNGADDPDVYALVDGVSMEPWPRFEISRPRTGEYLRAKGYGPTVHQAFLAMADTFLGRVQRRLTHPLTGGRCVTYYTNAVQDRSGTVHDELGNRLIATLDRLIERWLTPEQDLDVVENQLFAVADSWIRDRVVLQVD